MVRSSRRSSNGNEEDDEDDEHYYEEEPSADIAERWGLLPISKETKSRGPSIRRKQFDRRLHRILHHHDTASRASITTWLRPLWLGLGLFLLLCAFWLLDSLKDPVFAALLAGNLEEHQPSAKLFSVCLTLLLVGFLECVQHERKTTAAAMQQQQQQTSSSSSRDSDDDDDMLRDDGDWSRMPVGVVDGDDSISSELHAAANDRVPSSIFASIGIPYCLFFGATAYLLQFNPATATMTDTTTTATKSNTLNHNDDTSTLHHHHQAWHVLAYFLYAGIESFGSLMVATFWSYTNSTLNLHEAERYYGTIIAFAQTGAIAGSTMVTLHVWNSITLFVAACLILVLHILTMMTYARRFPGTSSTMTSTEEEPILVTSSSPPVQTHHHAPPTAVVSYWSGVYLILKHNYVLLILGVSCLYEVSLTCLNYQMTLLGWNRFEATAANFGNNNKNHRNNSISFTQFMGHYGQMVNVSSLILSSMVFPCLIRRFGLRHTLRLFPTLLLLANAVAFGALPGNLTVLFLSMSILKAMTYSIHDPAKEILYIPTSNAIKFKSKFWIDVVGARFAKAIGSSINTYAGSVDRSIRVASAPSLLTAAALWFVCYRVGTQFEQLVDSGTVVGLDDDDDDHHDHHHIQDYSAEHDEDGDGRGDVQESQQSVELTAL